MNYIWSAMLIASVVCAAVSGRLDETAAAAFEGAAESVKVLLSFAGIMCFWTGILRVAEKAGVCAVIEKLLSPVIRLLFPKAGSGAKRFIAMNMSANLLGMGNAATPMGIHAMEELDRENPHPLYPSAPMRMLAAVNTSSIQLIPTTVIALRAAAGSAAPADIMLPIWAASLFGLFAAVISTKIVCGVKRL